MEIKLLLIFALLTIITSSSYLTGVIKSSDLRSNNGWKLFSKFGMGRGEGDYQISIRMIKG